MNGLSTISTYESSVDRRPIITCAGELEVFSQIEDNLSQALPEENGEFRRTLGRPVRSVHISGTFAPFSAASLPKSNQWDLIRQPVFHIYWTECTDIDVYKTNVRDDIENWMKELTNKNINDWLIVVVENYDGKRTNKLLPRTTVLDKIRADFAPKQGDRCVSVINPGKLENRSADSWKSLVSRIRHLLLMAYAKAVTRLEDYVRQQRERRNEIGWNFMEYFNLQEELAQVLEMLGLNDEALVQYDELDALFSQFVVNGITSECVNWLNNFQKPLEKWHGLKLGPSKLSTNPSILEFRSYLFAKQAHMLLLTNKVWEMTSRCLPFLHTCIREITILEITTPPGAISCWLFLASIEVLQTCDKFNHADEVEAYSLHTASLWAYASQKLRDLGELCGLMPGGTPTSEQLHIVVGLSAGMGDNPGTPNSPSPTDKLKEALCSQTVFNKTYLELAELAMGTYKHIGRLRSARLVGRELASFYMLLGETQKAASFLADALTIFEQDGWHELSAITQIELVECYKKSNNIRNLIQSSANVSAAIEIDTLIRWQYFDEMRKYLDLLEENLCVPFDKIIKIINIKLLDDTKIIMQDNYINVELIIESNFPREILCTNLVISLILDSIKEQNKSSNNIISAEMVCKGNVLSSKDLKMQDPTMRKLHMWKILDYKQDKQLALAGCAPIEKVMDLKRKDSVVGCVSTDFSYSLEANNLPFLITPGLNVLRLKKQANKIGKFHLGHIGIHIGKLQLISQQLQPKLMIEVREESPSLRLYKRAAPLVSGIEQIMNLIITMGSYSIEPKSKIKLTASTGLTFHTKLNEDLVSSLEIEIGEQPPFSSTRLALRVLADMLSKDHQICIICPWAQKPVVVSLNFASPFSTTWRLHTLEHRKFIQVNVNGQCEKDLFVEKAELNVGTVCKAVGKNFDSSQIIYNGSSFSYMWELIFPSISTNPIKAEFLISYKLDGDSGLFKNYQHFFDITDYQTLFILDAYVEPTKGNEFCRIGAVCHLNLTINSTTGSSTNEKLEQNNVPKSVMYEVLAEPSVWAVCGRTAGVISFEGDLESQTVVLDVMPLSSGYLPLPLVRISKYIPADVADKSGKVDSHPRLEPFSLGQVYNRSKGKQFHVITAGNDGNNSGNIT